MPETRGEKKALRVEHVRRGLDVVSQRWLDKDAPLVAAERAGVGTVAQLGRVTRHLRLRTAETLAQAPGWLRERAEVRGRVAQRRHELLDAPALEAPPQVRVHRQGQRRRGHAERRTLGAERVLAYSSRPGPPAV